MAREFEQMRLALGDIFPGMSLDTGSPLLVLAPRDEETMKELSPAFWKLKGAKPAGYFSHGWDKEFAVVRLDLVSQAYQVVYHEYTHSVMHSMFRWLPTWLDEGLAEFFANTQFESKRLVVGAPNRRARVLRSRVIIPLETLVAVNASSAYYHDEDKVQDFYAESWALTHYLMFGPNMGMGKKMMQFARLLQTEHDQKKAFQQIFGDIKDTEKNLDQYISNPGLPIGNLMNPTQLEEEAFETRKLSPAESEAELGSFYLWHHEIELARESTEHSIDDDAKAGLAHENLGFLAFRLGKDEEAVQEFGKAIELDGQLYLSLFSMTMLSPQSYSDNATGQAWLREQLGKVLAINPRFAPAYVQLARLDVRQGNLAAALAEAQKAETLEQARAGYHVLSGQILLRLGHGPEAAAYAKYVADRWTGPDHDEALELWNKVPAAQRPAGELTAAPMPTGAQTIEGKVKTVVCRGKDVEFNVALDHDGQVLRFIAKSGFRGGFSDTLWYGRDHFSNCRHVDGLRGVVHYKPSADGAYAGELLEFDVRDDLPPSPQQKIEGSQPAANQGSRQ